jgi:DNA-binding transcriptional LysR family regulator
MIRNLDTQALRTFTTVAELASMTRAAEQLHLTQGAISQQIKRLEEQFQAPLFIRARRGLRLTEAGERLFGKARRLLSLNDTIWSEMTDTGCDGHVSIGVPMDLIAADAIPRLLRSFVERHGNVDLSVVCAPTAELKDRVVTGQIDLAVLEEHGAGQSGETLFADRLVWIGAKGGRAAGLDPLPLSMTSPSCVFRALVFEALDAAGRPWRSVFESGSREATLAMIRMDLAVGVVLASTAPGDVDALPSEAALPDLPTFNVTLARGNNVSRQAAMLADHIHRGTASAGVPHRTRQSSPQAV